MNTRLVWGLGSLLLLILLLLPFFNPSRLPEREPLFLKNRPAIEIGGPQPAEPFSTDVELLAGGARRFRHLVVLDGGRGS